VSPREASDRGAQARKRLNRDQQGWQKKVPVVAQAAGWPERRAAKAALRRKRRAAEAGRRASKAPRPAPGAELVDPALVEGYQTVREGA
jgi:hypothetical protein